MIVIDRERRPTVAGMHPWQLLNIQMVDSEPTHARGGSGSVV
jgi:hypothetical protein